jgi:hypothetical protein
VPSNAITGGNLDGAGVNEYSPVFEFGGHSDGEEKKKKKSDDDSQSDESDLESSDDKKLNGSDGEQFHKAPTKAPKGIDSGDELETIDDDECTREQNEGNVIMTDEQIDDKNSVDRHLSSEGLMVDSRFISQ